MKDKSKKLTVINTDKKIDKTEEKVVSYVAKPSSLNASLVGDYLPMKTWNKVFEFRKDNNGIEYLFGKLPLVLQHGVTMYAEGDVDVPSLAEGLPYDGRTIWFNPETQQIEVIGGTGGGEGGTSNFWELNNIPSWITQAKPTYQYSEIENTPDLSVYATTSLLNQTLAGYVTNNALANTLLSYPTFTDLQDELKGYVNVDYKQDVVGIKNFLNGLQIANMPITKLQDDVIYIDANLVVRGGVTMFYENGELDLPTIIDEIGIAGYDGKKLGLVSFSSSQFSIDANGIVTIIGGSTGLDTAQLAEYLTNNKYATQGWVTSQGYASSSSLVTLQTKVNDFLEGSDTDTIINKWKELESFLSGLSESDNLSDILATKANQSSLDATNATVATKWTQDNNKITQWNTAYGWGDHSKAGYALNSALQALSSVVDTKWTQDNAKISNWDTVYSWGNHASVGYALKSYVDKTFVTIGGTEDVTGLHNFVNGLKIGNIKLSKSQDGVLYLEGNLVVKGGVTMYALDEVTVDSIIDSLPLASTSQYGIAKFNPSNFIINDDGFVTIIGGSSGLDTEELAEYLTTNKYATQGWVEGKGYITSSALNGYATQSWVTNQKYITGITSAMVVSALGFTPYNSASFTKANIKSTLGISDWALASTKPSYNFSEIGTKPTTLGGYGITDAKISNGVITLGSATITPLTTHQTIYNLTLQAGTFSEKTFDPNSSAQTVNIPTTTSHISEGNNLYFTNVRAVSALTDTLKAYVTLSGTQTIVGKKDFTTGGLFVNGKQIIYDSTNKYWKLEGDLLVTGGVTMYGVDEGDLPSILDSLPIASTTALGIAKYDSNYFSVNSDGLVTLINAPSSGATSGLLGSFLLNVDDSVDTIADYDRILYQPAGSSMWTWKNLNEIGSSGGGGGSVSGDYLPLSGGTKLIFLTNQYYPDSNFAINLNNSDIIGTNAIYFDDTCNTAGEGLRFPRSNGNYDTLRVEDGIVKFTRNEPLRTENVSYDELWHSGNFNPKKLISWYGNSIDGENTLRPTSANSIYIDKSLRYYLATSSMKTGKPMADGMILHLAWDNAGWNSQLYIPNSYAASMQYRTVVDGQATTWADWISVIDSKGGKIDGDLTIQSIAFQGINEINSINNYKLHLNYRVPTDVSICVGGGNVGIGNSNPTEKVDILNNKSSTNTFVHTKRNDTGYGISFGIGSGGVNRGLYDENLDKWIIYADSTKTNLTDNIWINQSEWDNGLRLNRTINNAGCGISIYSNGTKIGVVGINGSQQLEFSIYSNNVNNQRFTVDKNGNGLFWGGITMYSDQRKKTILNHVELSLKQIADAPLIQHYYNSDQNKTIHVSSIAQYWHEINDWFCKEDSEGFLTMEIQNCALASAISIARELDRYETKTDKTTRKMKQRIAELEEEVERLKQN